ncbi:MAG: glycerophosphodiester phosphodiesterase family protein, partial [Bosea sp. (in: a-proteobacteria)]
MAVHRPIIAAHRGGALLWPENSMTAFRGALTLGVDQVETDVRLSRDGEPFILHDAMLDRTTEATGVASELEWDHLQRIRLKPDLLDTIPHLNDLLKLLKPSAVDLRLELKSDAKGAPQPGLAKVALAAVNWHRMLPRTTVTSFELRYLADVADMPVAGRIWLVRRTLLAEHGIRGIVGLAMAAGISELALHSADSAAVSFGVKGHAQTPRIGFFAVNDEASINLALSNGASAFTTD